MMESELELSEENINNSFSQENNKESGIILERDTDGRPVHWICGIDENGNFFDPPEVNIKEVIHSINKDGKREGNNSNNDEIKKWRTDWMD